MAKDDKVPQGNTFFQDYAEKVSDNGYNVIPIGPGTKRPYRHITNWQKIDANRATIRKWLGENCGQGGIGINTRSTPAVDIDVNDEDVALAMERFCIEEIGLTPVRIGKYPKRLLMYRSTESFRKMLSKKYLNEWMDTQRIEILGDGQQFVAFHIHPETKLPYRWEGETPLSISHDELPELTAADARRIIAEFERLAEEAEWQVIARGSINSNTDGGEEDDVFASDVQRATISDDELRDRLMLVPDVDDYDVWYQVGMALFHQFDGDYVGLDMWIEWSQTGEKFKEGSCEKKWRSFDITEKGRTPITARYILGLAKDAAETAAAELVLELTDEFNQARTAADWKEVIKKAKRAEIDSLARASLVDVAKKAYHSITGTKLPIQEVRRAMAYELSTDEMPAWCRDWIYDADDDKFFNTETKVVVTAQGFNAIHDRKALTKKDILEGKTSPSSSASQLALNIYRVPTVHGRMYAPGRDAVFIQGGITFANTYPENQVPALPQKVRPIDKRNIERVRRHVSHLLADEREQRLLLSWLAYVVQNPGRRVNWAILLQGTEGDGKSFFAFLLRAVMGIPNVAMLNASSFKSDFTGWAVGQCVAAVEELRLQGESRFDILNKIKPFITNDVVEIHAKGKTQFNADNTTNYILFTNFRDALPLNDNDRRYMVLFSRWQGKEALRQFNEENPLYYQELYGAIAESASALRKWLLDMELDDEFNPRGNAPHTKAHDIMVNLAMPQEIKAIKEVIKTQQHGDITEHLLNITKMTDEMSDLAITLPATSNWHTILSRDGWFPLDGRVRIDGRDCRFFSKTPEKFTQDGSINGTACGRRIRKYMNEVHKVPIYDPLDDEL